MKTEIARIGNNALENEKILAHAAEIIKSGGLVAFPTETVYGLGANAVDSYAAEKIYSAKGRPSNNPLIIHIASALDVDKYACVNDKYALLAEAFMPGPVTAILKKRDNIPMSVTGGLDSVAVRVPSHPIAHRLIELSGVPIAAPSANTSGRPSPTCATHVIEDLDGKIDMIIDGGQVEIGLESTIVKLDGEYPTLLRPGGVTLEQLGALFGEVKVDKAVTQKLSEGERPLAPGMMYRHYAPKSPLELFDGSDEDFFEFITSIKDKEKIAVIAYDEDIQTLIKAGVGRDNILSLGNSEDIKSHAARLFSLLRECDKHDFEKIYSRLPSREGISLALYNRIIKAAGYRVIS
ncbi:MAG: threonylcarbamoyl-AMP synthase [Ruminococcaceae bacterium]|nr:threonylcarbamoyl-AMP synthase [Oscillospiraceae bacterium]